MTLKSHVNALQLLINGLSMRFKMSKTTLAGFKRNSMKQLSIQRYCHSQSKAQAFLHDVNMLEVKNQKETAQ